MFRAIDGSEIEVPSRDMPLCLIDTDQFRPDERPIPATMRDVDAAVAEVVARRVIR
jgi:hypothetical protein